MNTAVNKKTFTAGRLAAFVFFAILLAIPFFWPVIAGLDFGMSPEDLKIWFGILALIVVELGLITPPVGMNVFILAATARHIPMYTIFKGSMPFFIAMFVLTVLIIAFPQICTWLPNTMLQGP